VRCGRPRRIRRGYLGLSFLCLGFCSPVVDNKRIDIDLAGQHRAGVTLAEMDLDLALLIWGPEPRKVVGQLPRIEMAQIHTLYTQKMGVSRRERFKNPLLSKANIITNLWIEALGRKYRE
jgi:hypothetical protein